MKRKVVFIPYDFDTAIGINNEGALVFSYNLEDIDHTESGADVFNGQQSVLWQNLRATFFPELRAMYQNLRSTGALSYDRVENMFEEHQSKWPEAIFNEDAWFKYLAPLVEKGNASYLAMLQGSKAEQRKWWLYNRFKYIDSKYNAGDSLSDVITVRGYAKADITVTPYADVYASIKYGSYLVQARAPRNTPILLECPLDSVNDTEVYIYSASQLASVGDLSGLMVGYADFSKALKLQSLKLGDGAASYSNSNLTELYLGNNALLRSIDVRDCPALTQAVNLAGCSNLETVLFDGTSITGLDLPNGGILKTLHLPTTMTNLTIRNQSLISDFSMEQDGVTDYSHITTLWLENVSPAIDTRAIMLSLAENSRVRLIGFSWNVEDYAAADVLLSHLGKMRGLDENGNNVDEAQVSGTLHINGLTGAELLDIQSRFPYITITYDHITSKLFYYNREGDTLLYTEVINDGGDGEYTATPAHDSTAQYNFTFAGWSRTLNGSADANARTAVTADRNVYAAYTLTVRTYSVSFLVDGTVKYTATNVPYGSSATYSGATPTKTGVSDPEKYQFVRWEPAATNITGNTSCNAVFKYLGITTRLIIDRTLAGTYENELVTSVRNQAFSACKSVTSISLPNALTVGELAFSYAAKLNTISLPKVTSVGQKCFTNCTALTEVNLPSATSIDQSAFYTCSKLVHISLPAAKTLGGSCFGSCTKLQSVELGAIETIGNYIFDSCPALKELVITNTAQVAQITNGVPSQADLVIYVPDALVDAYKNAERWSTVADKIKPLSERSTA